MKKHYRYLAVRGSGEIVNQGSPEVWAKAHSKDLARKLVAAYNKVFCNKKLPESIQKLINPHKYKAGAVVILKSPHNIGKYKITALTRFEDGTGELYRIKYVGKGKPFNPNLQVVGRESIKQLATP